MYYFDWLIIIFHRCYKTFVHIISIMLYIPKIGDYLKILIYHKMKEFVTINFSDSFKFTRKNLHSKLSEEQNLRKVAESLYIFLKTTDEVEKYVETMQSNSSNKYVHRHNIEILNLLNQNYN